jgi:serine/threonine protein kinase/Tol biopolymer transport system component
MQALSPGTIISHYRIVSIIGVGGMGEVYEVVDTNLDRRAALKILGQQFVRSDEAVERFVREARAASALNHPNIVTVFEVGDADVEVEADQGEGSTLRRIRFIAMERIDGETFRALIQRGELSLQRIVEVLAQTADGLAKAHRAGIVHRDLKPDNIMVTSDGFAKVLDFGLAKLMEREEDAADSLSRRLTQAGTIIGTAGYMSPEQVQHKRVDHRSDVFSFGCIVYQAIAGRGPFDADSMIDTLHNIVHATPEPLPPDTPAPLAELTRACLAKEPEDRPQSMSDIARELHEVARSLAPETKVPQKTRNWIPALLAAVAILASVGTFLALRRPRSMDAFATMKITGISGMAHATAAAISPDGRYVAFAAEDRGKQSLSIRQLATGSDVPIVPLMDVHYVGCAFSPDGNYLYYVSAENKSDHAAVYSVPALGGSPRRLIDDLHARIAVSPDGRSIAYTRIDRPRNVSTIAVRPLSGGAETVIATRKLPDAFGSPAWSPDGKQLAWSLSTYAGGFHTVVGESTLAGRAERVLQSPKWRVIDAVAWIPDGRAVLVNGKEGTSARNQLWLLSVRDGKARRITNDLSDYESAAITTDGTRVVTLQRNQTSSLSVAPAGDASRVQPLVRATDALDGMWGVSATRDGIVYGSASGDARDVWVVRRDGKPPQRITDTHADIYPAASPDGSSVVFVSMREGKSNLWRASMAGGDVAQVTTGNFDSSPQFTPDGKYILFHSNRSGARTIWRAPTAGGVPEQLTKAASSWASPSPDGASLACSWFDRESGRAKIAIVPAAGGTPSKLFDIPVNSWMGGNNHLVRWRGNALTYVHSDAGVSNIWSQPIDGSAPAQTTHFTDGQIFFFDWTPDGDLVVARGNVTSNVVMIETAK